MKQLGNLAIVCARRKSVLMQIHNGMVSVHVGTGPERATMVSAWDDDQRISQITYELNFGHYQEKNAA